MSESNRKWLGGALLFMGGFFVLLAAQEGCYQKAPQLQGTAIEKVYQRGTSSIGGSPGTPSKHQIRYRFTTPDGKTKEALSDVLLNNWSKLREGDTVDVEYLPATGDSRIAGQTAKAGTFLGIALALLAGGLWMRRPARRKARTA